MLTLTSVIRATGYTLVPPSFGFVVGLRPDGSAQGHPLAPPSVVASLALPSIVSSLATHSIISSMVLPSANSPMNSISASGLSSVFVFCLFSLCLLYPLFLLLIWLP